jgi:membrane associated rhomboid family serine protease
VGVEEPEKKPPEPKDDLLGFRNRLIMGVVFAILYMSTFGPRTGWLAAVVSGVLGGAVVFLLLKEVDERRKRRRR